MKKLFPLRLAIAMTALAASLSAAEQPLTWEDCVRLTAEHNPALAAASASVDEANSAIGVARAAMLPQLSAGASAEQSHRDGEQDEETTAYGASLRVEQLLYDGGTTKASIRSAEAGLHSETASLAGSRADVTYALRSAFIDVLHAQERVTLLAQIEARRTDNLELVDLRYEGGREHKGSLASSQASLFDAQVQGKQAARAVAVDRQVLARTMGLASLPADAVVTGTLEQVNLPETADIETLASETPGYVASVASRERAEAQLSEARSGYRPDISLTGSAGRFGDEDAFEEDRWAVGLSLSFPLWSGGQTRHEVSKATAALRAAEADVADVLNDRVRFLAEAEQSLADTTDNVDVQAKYVEAAGIRAQIARQQYEDGLLSFENWIVIEDDLIARKEQLLDTRKSALLTEAAWWQATGYEVFSETRATTGGKK